jgi:hypothetical protein
MGIDIHLGNHYYGFRVPAPLLWLVALAALYAAFMVGRFLLAAIGGWTR